MTEQLNDLQAELSPAQDLSIDTTEMVNSTEIPEVVESNEPNGFVQLGLADELVKAVADLGYTQPTAVRWWRCGGCRASTPSSGNSQAS